MTVSFIIYDADGVILRTGTCLATMRELQAHDGEFVLEGIANDATQYVDATRTIKDKLPLGGIPNKTSAIADGNDLVIIENLPNPTTASLRGPGVSQTVLVTDGALELTFTVPGEYRVQLSARHRLGQEVVINAA